MQIVLLATKFVGDYLGKDGIADEMIRFNGYPYLHANEHAYNIPGGLVLPHSITLRF
jgi:chloride channel 3/4/5